MPAPDDLLEAYEISTAVNRTSNDNVKLVERLSEPAGAEPVPARTSPRRPGKRVKKDNGQGALF